MIESQNDLNESVVENYPQFPEFLHKIADLSPGFLFVVDLVEPRIIYTNKKVTEFLGKDQKFIYNKGKAIFKMLLHPSHFARHLKEVQKWKNLSDDEERHQDLLLRSGRNDWKWFRVTCKAFEREEKGKVIKLIATAQDIHEQKMSEEALKEEQRRFKDAQAIGNSGNFERKLPGDILICSEEFMRIHGLDPGPGTMTIEEFISKVHPDEQEDFRAAVDHTHRTGEPLDVVNRIVRPDGSIRYLHRRSAIFQDEKGVPVRVYGTVQDVSERVKAEEERQKLDNLLLATEKVARTGSYEFDVSSGTWYFSDGLFRLFGENPKSFKPSVEWLESRINPGDAPVTQKILQDAIKNKKPYSYTHRICTRSGERRVVETHGKVLTDLQGNTVKLIGLVQDVTERTKAEAKLLRREKQTNDLLKVLQNAPDAYLVLSSDLHIKLASDAYLEMTMTTRSKIIGQYMFDVFPDNSEVREAQGVGNLAASMEQVLSTGHMHRMTIQHYHVRRSDGSLEEKFWSPINIPVLNDQNEVEYIIHRVIDVTEPTKKKSALKGLSTEAEILKTSLEEIKAQAAELKKNKALLQSIFDGSPNSILLFKTLYDDRGRAEDLEFLMINAFTLEFTGATDKAIGKRLSEVFPQVKSGQVLQKLLRTASSGRSADFETWYEGEGLHHWLRLRANRVHDYLVVTTEDISERKKAEQELLRLQDELAKRASDSEDRFRSLVTTSSDSIFKVSADWNIMYNLNGKDFLDNTDNPSNSWIEHYIPENQRQRVRHKIQEAIRKKEPFELEHQVISMDGNVSWTYSRAIPKFNDRGEIVEWFGAASDITERKKAEERQSFFLALNDAIRLLTEKPEIVDKALRLLLDQIQADRVFFAEVTETGNTLMVISSQSRSLVPAWKAKEVLFSRNRIDHRFLAGQTVAIGELREASELEHALENKGISAFVGVPVFKEERLAGVLCVEHIEPRKWTPDEISLVEELAERLWTAAERAKTEKALRESEQRFRNLVEASALAVWETSASGIVNKDSPSWRKSTGQTFEEAAGEGWLEAVHPDDRAFAATQWKEATVSEKDVDVEFRLRSTTGDYRWVNIKATPIYDIEGRVTKWSGMNLDIHDRKMAEKELLKAKEEAEAAYRAKDEFVSTVSHEIRTPLNAVIGLTNLLLEQNPKKDQIENLNSLSFSAKNLLSLINDILDFSKLEAGKMELKENQFDLRNLLFHLQQAHNPQARINGTKLHLRMDDKIPVRIAADQLKLSQILHNLVSNAVKFTRKGRVVIEVDLNRRQEQQFWLDFTIRDTGIGIEAEKLEHIFEKFAQAETSTVRHFGGTGLGLSITKLLLDLMGSEIQVESQVNQGSRFFFTLPVRMAGEKDSSGKEEEMILEVKDLHKMRLLLVEDVEINRKILLQFLDNWWKIRPDEAVNGKDAVEMAEQNKYDLILMDVRMPVMDGYEATTRIRKLPGYKEVPVLALTADRNQALIQPSDSVFTDVLTKPFEPADLKIRILENLHHSASPMKKKSSKKQVPKEQFHKKDPDVKNQEASFEISRYEKIAEKDPEILVKLVQNAARAFEIYKTEFISAADQADEKALSNLVHKNTTSVHYVQANKLAAEIQNYRQLLKEANAEEKKTKKKVDLIVQEFDIIIDGLKAIAEKKS